MRAAGRLGKLWVGIRRVGPEQLSMSCAGVSRIPPNFLHGETQCRNKETKQASWIPAWGEAASTHLTRGHMLVMPLTQCV